MRCHILVAACATSALAASTIDIALQASFPTPPFLVELLETAATEDSNAFLPLLDRIAAGTFAGASTEKELYDRFLNTIEQDRLLPNAAAISSWKLALSVHEAAPRIAAQYQFWNSSVKYLEEQAVVPGAGALLSVWKPNGEWCADDFCSESRRVKSRPSRDHRSPRPFDRTAGPAAATESWTVYVDPSDSRAIASYANWRAKFPEASFRLRYRLPKNDTQVPLPVSGYGVELALKRTDYIVIDDRDAEKTLGDNGVEVESVLDQAESRDVKPLSSSELQDLGVKAASYILGESNPVDTLTRLSQDMPKYAAQLAAHNISEDFVKEHRANREQLLPPGYNMLWMNGAQVSPRDVNVFSLLDQLRRERRLISGLRTVGLTNSEANKLLSHPAIVEKAAGDEPQRYDFRDALDGGKVIMWFNNIEKDKRYAEWPTDLRALLQRTFPGQMPPVRRDIHNIVFPIDLTSTTDATFATVTVLNLVHRMVPVRFGIVPMLGSESSIQQAKVVYYLQETYGLAAVMEYLELSLNDQSLSAPSEAHFTAVTSERNLRRDATPLIFSDVLSSSLFDTQVASGQSYLKRLSMNGKTPPFLVNGAAIPFDEDWMQGLGQRLTMDLRKIQAEVYEEKIAEDSWLPEQYLKDASSVRNPTLVPEDEASVAIFDMSYIYKEHAKEIAGLKALNGGINNQPSIIVFMDLMTDAGLELLINTIDFALNNPDVQIALDHFSESRSPQWSDRALEHVKNTRPELSKEAIGWIKASIEKEPVTWGGKKTPSKSPLAQAIGLKPGQQGVLVSGRLVGPLPATVTITPQDFETLITYEFKKRLQPTLNAVEALGLSHLLRTPHDLAKLSSIVALSSISDVPEGIFDTTPGPRTSIFDSWKSEHTLITLGQQTDPTINFVVSLDPVSETAQQWVPTLRTLAELGGVQVRIFINPREKIQELPVKRFYRQVLSASPGFTSAGSLEHPKARFEGIPEETLLTLAMDTPPSWLVAPEESVYDLDNIKLASLKPGENVNATYELEHILIEGHSRETLTGAPPRGAQLLLGTETQADLAGTIVMANLGYFQFKANPGIYDLALQSGKSDQIFSIDSAGTMGHAAQAGDETREVGLLSFQGATIFPRLSRNAGQEAVDVLDMPGAQLQQAVSGVKKQAQNVVEQAGRLADDALAKAGFSHIKATELAAKGMTFASGLLSSLSSSLPATSVIDVALSGSKHADINIFSVASGHLYERMLNIMMVSVMRHTKHTVKFWFIEQFLSPSFKTFLPSMAAEYGFDYEMVTYKWPHWLRAQKEKQRVIWGYKILFLDVLFPLDLDKVIFVDADQIVRTDMYDLVKLDLEGAPYGFTPMCDSRTEMEGFRFWKQGYWKTYLRGLPYHISALYVVDLKMFRAMAAGDRLRGQYQSLSADPQSLSNLDQDLPNHMQMNLPIHSLPQEWLWCETWCDDESLKTARTIDLCNNPQTKEPKLDRARRQVPEWTEYDEEIAALARRKKEEGDSAGVAVEGAEEPGSKDPRPVKDEL